MINEQLKNLITSSDFTNVASYKDEENNNALHLLFKEGSKEQIPAVLGNLTAAQITELLEEENSENQQPLEVLEDANIMGCILDTVNSDVGKLNAILQSTDSLNNTIFHRFGTQEDVVKKALEQLSDQQGVVKESLKLENADGHTALHLLFKEGYEEQIKAVVDYLEDFDGLISKTEIDAIADVASDQLDKFLGAFEENDANLIQILEKVDVGTNLLHKLVNDGEKSDEVTKIFGKITDEKHLKTLLKVTVNNETFYDLDVTKGVLTADKVSSYFTEMVNTANDLECNDKETCDAKKIALEAIKVNDGYSSLSQQKTAAIGGVNGQLAQYNITNDDKSKVIDLVWQSFNADKLREKSSDMKTKFDGVKTQYNLASSQCPWNADADQLKKSNCQQFQDDAGKAFHFASKDLITEYIQLMEKNSGVGDGVEDKACKRKQNDSEFGLNYQYKVEVCKDIKKNNPIKTVVGNMDGIGKTGDQRSVGYEWLKTETSNKAKEVVHGKSMNIKQIATEFCGNSGSIGEASFAATDAYQDMCDLTALKTEFSVYIDSLET